VQEAKRRSGQVIVSCFRGSEARAILNRNGKKDQSQLYYGWTHRLPGYNPANPPGYSTHECHNDGSAYSSYRRGARIPDELVGQDWTNAWTVVQAYNNMGIPASLTYPTSPLERHHLNIRVTRSRWKWKRPPMTLTRGMTGASVKKLVHELHYCRVPKAGGKRYLPLDRKLDASPRFFGQQVERAVKRFQRDHGLKADGIVGPHTRVQISASAAYWRSH
jgi:peptidoglycan hydrolase-like protein with peptidoglycan-binding domain